jgi:hypothetical protein
MQVMDTPYSKKGGAVWEWEIKGKERGAHRISFICRLREARRGRSSMIHCSGAYMTSFTSPGFTELYPLLRSGSGGG